MTSPPFIEAGPVVKARGLTKSYGGRRVVDHLDLDVQAGEVVGLIGGNGAGKTTTVEILQGLRARDAGQVWVLGLDPGRDADRLRPQIGSQLQSSGLPDRIRVGEAITLFADRRAVAAPVYGIPEVEDWLRVAAGVVAGSIAFVCIGVLLGTVLPSARAAQAIGLLLFFPSFLLGVGGPPPAVMSEPLREIADRLPLAVANQAVREPWLGIGDANGALVVTAVVAVVATALAARRSAL